MKFHLIIIRSSPLIVLYRQAYIEVSRQKYPKYKKIKQQKKSLFPDEKAQKLSQSYNPDQNIITFEQFQEILYYENHNITAEDF